MNGYLAFLTLLIAITATACSQSDLELLNVEPAGALPGLPQDVGHLSSATDVLEGVDYLTAGPGVTDNPPAIELDATGIPISWAMYGYGVAYWQTLESLALSTESINGEYWVGLAVYQDINNWEFLGPFTEDCLIPLGTDPTRYLSPTDNLHWVVVAANDCSLTLNNSTVETGGTPPEPVFFVPPSGQHTVFDGPATDPYLFFMDNTLNTAENGAPIVLYTADNEGLQDSYLGWYNGTEWERRLLNSEKQVTHARGCWAGDKGYIFAYYYEADAFGHSQYKQLTVNGNLEIVVTGSAGVYDRYPDVVDFTYRRGINSWTLIFANNEYEDVHMRWQVNGYGGTYGDFAIPNNMEVLDTSVTLTEDGNTGLAIYTFGTPDAEQKIHNMHHIRQVKFNGESWSYMPSDVIMYNEAIAHDLHYNAAGELELLLVSARDYQLTVPPELDVVTTLYQDVSLGTYNGSDWEFTTLFTGMIDDSNKDSGELGVDIGIDAHWAGTDAMLYLTGNGTVTFSSDPEFHYTGGMLATAGNFLVRDGESFSPSTDFIPGPALNYVWAESPAGMACVYLDTSEVPFSTVASCELDQASGSVIYWAP